MGGVDLNDQMRSYYPSGRPGKKWWRYLLWFLLDVSITNAFILEHLSLHAASSRARRSLLQFKLELAKQLIGGYCGRKRYPWKEEEVCLPRYCNRSAQLAWSSRSEVSGTEKKPVSTAQIMDERPHPDVTLKPPMVVTGVE